MQLNTLSRILHVLLNSLADMAAVVVHRQIQLSVATVGPSQFIEQLHEQLVVFALSGYPMKTTRSEVERPTDPHLVVGAGSVKGLLLTFTHPAKTHFGVGFYLGL